jgi:uncharacterized protein (DUF983 family)
MRRKCPACGAEVVQLSLSNVRRRRMLTCTQCGVKLEIAVPGATYGLVTLSAVILGSMLVPALFMLMFEKRWAMVALTIALLFALILGSNEFLNRRTTVQLAPGQRPG